MPMTSTIPKNKSDEQNHTLQKKLTEKKDAKSNTKKPLHT